MGLLKSIGKVVGKVASVAGPAIGAMTGNPFLSTALNVAGGLFGNKAANDMSMANAQQSQDFTKEMMQNRHQWEVSDLKAAGLNPMLSAGAAPSMGSSAQAQTFNPVDDSATSQSTALATKRLQADLENIRAQTMKLGSDTSLNTALERSAEKDALLKVSSAQAAQAAARNSDANTALSMMNERLAASDLPGRKVAADFQTKYGPAEMRYHAIMDALNRINPFVSSASEAKRSFSPVKFK